MSVPLLHQAVGELCAAVKVAHLQSEFCTKDFFSSYEFSYEKCSEIFPEIFEPLFCGSEKIPGKFPPNFPLNFPNFPVKNQKKFTDELLQERSFQAADPSKRNLRLLDEG